MCLVCIQCFEVNKVAKCQNCNVALTTIQSTLKRRLSNSTDEVNEMMNEGFKVLVENSSSNMSTELLEGFAKVRLSLSKFAFILQRTLVASSEQELQSSQLENLVRTAKHICSDANVNIIDTSGGQDTTGPIVYLLRVLVRQYGMSCLEKVSASYPWVIPKELTEEQKVRLIHPMHSSDVSSR